MNNNYPYSIKQIWRVSCSDAEMLYIYDVCCYTPEKAIAECRENMSDDMHIVSVSTVNIPEYYKGTLNVFFPLCVIDE